MVLSPGTGLGNILFVAVYNTARSDLLVWPWSGQLGRVALCGLLGHNEAVDHLENVAVEGKHVPIEKTRRG